jgi:N utilization substance protein B
MPKVDRARLRASARLAAVQALYQMEFSGQGTEEVVAEFVAMRLDGENDGETLHEADAAFFAEIVRGVIANQVEIDRAVDQFLADDWPLARVEAILRTDVPARVALNEYTDLSAAFFGEAETVFANGVLNKLARAHRAPEFERAS